MLNICVLTGRLVEDPELRTTKSDVHATSLRLAVQRDYTKDGEKITDFFDVIAWRGTAEFVCEYFHKGNMISVAGKIQNRSWSDKNGDNRVKTEIIADNVYFAESKPKDANTFTNPLDFD
jgi:single-strand DNA-binding protein